MTLIETEMVEPKKDGRGRKLTPRVERKAQVRAYRASGLTQRAFAERERINYSTFVSWVQEFPELESVAVSFAEVATPSAGGATRLEAQLPNGVVIRGEVDALARLLQRLQC